MKKFLSLVLALVMTMSLVTISAGAKDFTDDSKITYDEAVDVISAVKVVDGYTDGSFNPTATLTRGAAAKIICNLILGPTTASALKADAAPYSDVPADSTFAGYIAFCAKEGIISGYADGTFKPGNSLTGYAFMKMLLGALGYDKAVEGYEGANWSINVAKRALNIGLDKGLVESFNGVKPVTREEACLYALNTLKADMVEYDTKTSISIGGTDVVIAGSKAQEVTTNSKSVSINDEGDPYTVQFGEKYFPKLVLKNGVDGTYGRPSHTWIFNKEEVGTYAEVADYIYTDSVKNDDVYDEVGKTVCNYKTWTYWMDGVDKKAAAKPVNNDDDNDYGETKTGRTTEIYVNTDKETVTVVYFDQYLGEVSKVKTNADDEEYITIKAADAGVALPTLTDKTFKVEGYEAEDLVVFTVNNGKIASVCEPETVTGKVTAVEKSKVSSDSYIELDDEKYTYNAVFAGKKNADPDLKGEYNLYLDTNGYIVGFEVVEAAAKNYLYVKDAEAYLGDIQAKVVLSDGTKATIDVADKLKSKAPTSVGDIKEYVCAYTKSEKDVYTLEPISKVEFTTTIENKSAWVKSELVDEDTLFVDVKDNVTYTGYESVPNYTNAQVITIDEKKDGVQELVFIVTWDAKDSDDGTYFYVAKTGAYKTKTDADDVDYTVRTVYVDGEKTELLFVDDANADDVIATAGLYKAVTTNDKGYVTKVTAYGAGASLSNYETTTVGKGSFANGQTQALTATAPITSKYWIYTDDTQFILVDGTDVSIGSASDMIEAGKAGTDADDVHTYVTVVKADKNKAEIVYIYNVEYKYMYDATQEAAAVAKLDAYKALTGTETAAALTILKNDLTAVITDTSIKAETKTAIVAAIATMDAKIAAAQAAEDDATLKTAKETAIAKIDAAVAGADAYKTMLSGSEYSDVLAAAEAAKATVNGWTEAPAADVVNAAGDSVAAVYADCADVTAAAEALGAASIVANGLSTEVTTKVQEAIEDVDLGVTVTYAYANQAPATITAAETDVTVDVTLTVGTKSKTVTGVSVTYTANDYVALTEAAASMPTSLTVNMAANAIGVTKAAVKTAIQNAIAGELGTGFTVNVASGNAAVAAGSADAGDMVAQTVVVRSIKYTASAVTLTQNFTVDVIIKFA